MAFKKSLVVAATMAVAAFGAALEGIDECASTEPSAGLLAAAKEMAAQEAAVAKTTDKRADVEDDIVVPTYIHVIASSESKADGYLSKEDVLATVNDMNGDYKGLGFQFDVQDVTHTINSDWVAGQNADMKRQLREGDYKTLNIYFVPKFRANGQCFFPSNVNADSPEFWRDGCTLLSKVYNNKQTTTHEVGHWLGLFHTFQGGCDEDNDFVADTPALINDWSCDENDDTCPEMPGKDPVNNFMSYGTCRNQFTPGQSTRMKSMYQKYRA